MSNNLKWHAAEQPEDLRENEPTQEEFFSHADIVSEVSSLVRESTQNTLDEQLDKTKPVRMIFTLGEQTPNKNNSYFSDLIPHIDAVKEIETPDLDKKSKFLVIEDFNTLGLEGGISAVARTDEHLEKIERESEKSKESFYYFQWKSGGSNKKAGSKGSWGVGKIVFPRASGAKSYLVYSVRREFAEADAGPELLFGLSILNYRWVNGKRYVPDTPWMITNKKHFNHPVPSENAQEINEFVVDWKLSRKAKETGTSIVIPFVSNDLTAEKLIQSICRDYFINILSGVLECEVKDIDGSTVVLSKSTLINVIKTLGEDMTTRASKSGTELIKLCEMFEKSLLGAAVKFNIDYLPSEPNNWSAVASLEDSIREEMERCLESSQILDVHVQTLVPEFSDPKKGKIAQANDSFRVLLQKSNSGNSSTVFCREGILIPDANNNSKLQDLISLVLIGDVAGKVSIENSLANLLKWSEGPSHETWSSGATKFGQRYKPKKAGEDVIRWVKNSASRVIELIKNEEEVSDDKSLSDYAPDDDEGSGSYIADTSTPRVLLSIVKGSSSSPATKLLWVTKNLVQKTYDLKQLSPSQLVLKSGSKENDFQLTKIDPVETYEFQVTVSDGSQTVMSNKVRIKPSVTSSDTVRVEKSISGFRINPINVKKVGLGDIIEVRAAHPTRNDSSVGSWSESDFILSHQLDKKSLKGLKTLVTSNEKMQFEILDADYEANWSGFDPLRDLTILAKIVGV